MVYIAKKIPQNFEFEGRRVGLPEGSYIDSLVSLRKAIVLCWKCRRKFNEKTSHYKKPWNIPYVRMSRCDGCRVFQQRAEIFIHEEMNYL